jgi:magnesium transporter
MKKPGASPGSLVFVGEQKLENVRISVIDYDPEHLTEKEVASIEETFGFRDTASVTWINLWGLHDVEVIEKLGKHFGLHSLLLEDILNTTQRPKIEDFGEYIYIALKMIHHDPATQSSIQEHVSIVIGHNFVLSFQERVGDVFENVRVRLRSGKGRIRKMGPDYLAYALMDALVDGYFVVLESVGERVEALEEEVMGDPDTETLQNIHRLKREAILMRRAVWPLREVVSIFEKGESDLVHEGTDIFLRDLYDHTIQIIDTIESYRDVVSGLMDLYMSVISNKMNEVMKVLTIIATIFIPLTFIAGIYGMNFEYMPELGWRSAYFVVWGIIVGVGAAMLLFFRRLKWL